MLYMLLPVNIYNYYEINVRLGHIKLRIRNMRNAIIKIIIIHINYFLRETAFK